MPKNSSFRVPPKKPKAGQAPVGDGLRYNASGLPTLKFSTNSPFFFEKGGLTLNTGYGLEVFEGQLRVDRNLQYFGSNSIELNKNSFEIRLAENSGLLSGTDGLEILTDKTLLVNGEGELRVNYERTTGDSLVYANGQLDVYASKGLVVDRDGLSVLLGSGLTWEQSERGYRVALADPNMVSWGKVKGDLLDQKDLSRVLKEKAEVSHEHNASDIKTGVLSQHVIPAIPASKIQGELREEVFGVIPGGKIKGAIPKSSIPELEENQIKDIHIESVNAKKIEGVLPREVVGENFSQGKVLTANGWELPFNKKVVLRPMGIQSPTHAIAMNPGQIVGGWFQFAVPKFVQSIRSIVAVMEGELLDQVCLRAKTYVDFCDLSREDFNHAKHAAVVTNSNKCELLKDFVSVKGGDMLFIRVEREAVNPLDKFMDTIYLKYVIIELNELND